MSDDRNDLLDIDTGNKGGGNPDGNTNTSPSDNGSAPPETAKQDPKDFGKDWKEYIPQDLKDRSEWNNIKDPSDLFKNYISSQQMISKSVRIPDAASSPEDVAAFYTKLGKPQNKSDYTVEYKPTKKEYIYDAESFDMDTFKDIADKANLTKSQFQALATAYIDVNNEMYVNYNQTLGQNAAKELKEAEHKLRADWGAQYNQNINAITEKVQKLYSKATLEKMKNAGLFRDADFLSSHLKLTKMMTGDTVFIEGNAVENVPQTLQTLQTERDKLMSEDYSKNRDKVLELNQQIVRLKQSQQSGASKFHG